MAPLEPPVIEDFEMEVEIPAREWPWNLEFEEARVPEEEQAVPPGDEDQAFDDWGDLDWHNVPAGDPWPEDHDNGPLYFVRSSVNPYPTANTSFGQVPNRLLYHDPVPVVVLQQNINRICPFHSSVEQLQAELIQRLHLCHGVEDFPRLLSNLGEFMLAAARELEGRQPNNDNALGIIRMAYERILVQLCGPCHPGELPSCELCDQLPYGFQKKV